MFALRTPHVVAAVGTGRVREILFDSVGRLGRVDVLLAVVAKLADARSLTQRGLS